jgi:hypothetical protein
MWGCQAVLVSWKCFAQEVMEESASRPLLDYWQTFLVRFAYYRAAAAAIALGCFCPALPTYNLYDW